MKTNYLSQPVLMEKAIKALIEKLGIAKATEFWTSLGYGKEDYSFLRKKMFSKETVESLYRKIKKRKRDDFFIENRDVYFLCHVPFHFFNGFR